MNQIATESQTVSLKYDSNSECWASLEPSVMLTRSTTRGPEGYAKKGLNVFNLGHGPERYGPEGEGPECRTSFFVILLHAGTYEDDRLNLPRSKGNKPSKKSTKKKSRIPQSTSTPILKPPAETVQQRGYYNWGMPPYWEHNKNHQSSFNQSSTRPPSGLYDYPIQTIGNLSSNGHSSQFVAHIYGMSSASVQGMPYPMPTPSLSTVHE
ncbi:hypothetical protein DAPPUDRAFT_110068 [Daphnia pulex]|uniref:Uncharacterized protein n=1 Tax=Daphnia pulex TaxID=6669 RepID=E9H541_DAPPU|nr:hypothetical protein DAPPUDRAFT_110068 [Daphnia pulex]|eukprot:EFX73065.1 hypothetical protein DAPPUDRAFT_110068 [Daphnia pulex]